jgi:hypothetical protein
MSTTNEYRRTLLTFVVIQVLALLGGFFVLYTCTSKTFPHHNLSETIYWGTIGLLGFMFLGIAFPLTLIVILLMTVLMVAGSSWKRVRILTTLGLLLWGIYWISMAYEICVPSPD